MSTRFCNVYTIRANELSSSLFAIKNAFVLIRSYDILKSISPLFRRQVNANRKKKERRKVVFFLAFDQKKTYSILLDEKSSTTIINRVLNEW